MTTATAVATDRIERSIHVAAPRTRVWRALSQAEEFGAWFGAELKGQRFAAGERVRGSMAGHPEIDFDAIIERCEPEHLIAWRWHPYAPDPKRDYSAEPRTLVTFTLQDVDGGTLVTVVESGFDQLPAARRTESYPRHERGWDFQLGNLERHATAR